MPILCLLLLSGCSNEKIIDNGQREVTELGSIAKVESYIRDNNMFIPDYSTVANSNSKGNSYAVESYYQMYDENGFLDKVCIGNFSIDKKSGEVKGSITEPSCKSVYKGINQGLENLPENY
ncbi:MAG: hypothetical protein RRZ84_02570 [Romboutsia sp.]